MRGENSWCCELPFNVIKIIVLTKFQELLNASVEMSLSFNM